MKVKKTGYLLKILLLAGISLQSFAGEYQMPQCLASQITWEHKILAQNKLFQLIQMNDNKINQLVTLSDQVHCGKFVNVSRQHLNNITVDSFLNQHLPIKSTKNTQYQIKHQEAVNKALSLVNSENIEATLTKLTSFYNRDANSKTGVATAKYLKQAFEAMAKEYGRTDTKTFFVKTGSMFKQPSLVTVIGKDLPGEAVVVGAHMDTLSGRMPGAGDDGSGSSSVMEMARVMMASQMNLKRPVYFIWYSAEEQGLVGSQYVVSHFQKNKIAVKTAIQFDMTGYRNSPNDATMWVYDDYTDGTLSKFVEQLITTYVKVPVSHSSCGYGCSDHASWDEVGIPAAFPCETNFDDHNPYIHTEDDTMSLLSLEHMTNFSKLGLAYAIELALE